MHFESDISACFNSFAKVKFKISELVNSGGGIAIFLVDTSCDTILKWDLRCKK